LTLATAAAGTLMLLSATANAVPPWEWRIMRKRYRLPYAQQLANDPLAALRENQALAKGVIAYEGAFTSKEAAHDLSLPFTDLSELI